MAQVSIDIVGGYRLTIGTDATFRIQSSIEGVLLVYAVNPAGQLVQLFPNNRVSGYMPGQATPTIRAGETMLLPGPADGFRARVQPPAGAGVVCVVVLPPTAEARAAVDRHANLAPVPDPDAFRTMLEGLTGSARLAANGRLPSNAAIGSRLYEVLAP
jgi:hypothetical protein